MVAKSRKIESKRFQPDRPGIGTTDRDDVDSPVHNRDYRQYNAAAVQSKRLYGSLSGRSVCLVQPETTEIAARTPGTFVDSL
jgi:hypothetical protein